MHCRLSRLVPNPAWPVWVFLLVGASVAMASVSEVQVRARVEAIAQASGPAAIELEPGETRDVSVQVAANFSWKLAVHPSNPAVTATFGTTAGGPGGYSSPGNTFNVVFSCAPTAAGTQASAIQYSLARR